MYVEWDSVSASRICDRLEEVFRTGEGKYAGDLGQIVQVQ